MTLGPSDHPIGPVIAPASGPGAGVADSVAPDQLKPIGRLASAQAQSGPFSLSIWIS